MIKLTLLTLTLLYNSLSISSVTGLISAKEYKTSNLQSISEAKSVFNKLYRNRKGWSQCYDRAHYWSYQMYKNNNIYSEKIFIFFTKKYTREINGRWWFHVAPALYIQNKLHVFDPEFLGEPVPFEVWKNGAIDHAHYKLVPIKKRLTKQLNYNRNQLSKYTPNEGQYRYWQQKISQVNQQLDKLLIKDTNLIPVTKENFPYNNMREILSLKCREIDYYSQLNLNSQNDYCYIMRTSMYFLAPKDIENFEKQAFFSSSFNYNRVFSSFKRGFWGYFPY